MKKLIAGIFLCHAHIAIAQTNTFPATGNAGVGTLNPAHQLHVVNGFKSNSLYIGAASDFTNRYGDGDNIYIRQPLRTGGGWWGVHMSIQGPLASHTASFYPVRYMTDENNDGYEDTERFYINKTGGGYFGGNLGIGVVDPSEKLQIEGQEVGILVKGQYRSRLNLSTLQQQGWQIEVGNADVNGNQYGGDLGFTESGVAGGRLVLKKGGNVGIGILNPTEKLSINGNIKAKKLIVTQTGWPDYVFHPAYKLKPLSELEQFIQKNKHLPEMPSAKEVEEKGISVGDNQALLLKKIEELTLYMIELKKENQTQQRQIEQLLKSIKQ